MLPFKLPQFPELRGDSLPEDVKLAIMPLSENNNKDIEEIIFRTFVYAVVTNSSDVHIGSHGGKRRPEVFINIRTPAGFVNFKYEGDGESRHFETKMLKLANVSQGGSTPEMLSTRFSMAFPVEWAKSKGLKPDHGKDKYFIDVRMEYSNPFDGFAFTCRILDQQRAPDIHELGLPYALETLLKKLVSEPSGLILASGPTGSGKTTLLNAILRYLNNGQNSIFTIENPVEFRLQGDGPIKQIQVHGDVTFARALRSGLRSDPDIILIGEIRDAETMEIALQAAQTGHLVLSTLHANSAADTISRALDLTLDKVRDATRLADTLKFVMAQRLIDKYEPQVAERSISNHENAWLTDNGVAVHQTIHETTSTKKIGKIALIEAIEIDYPIKQVIQSERMNTDKIYELASTQLQYETLVMAGIRAVESGHARINDCQARLDTNRAAGAMLPYRTNLVNKLGVNYTAVSEAIDQYVLGQKDNQEQNVEDIILRIKEEKHAIE